MRQILRARCARAGHGEEGEREGGGERERGRERGGDRGRRERGRGGEEGERGERGGEGGLAARSRQKLRRRRCGSRAAAVAGGGGGGGAADVLRSSFADALRPLAASASLEDVSRAFQALPLERRPELYGLHQQLVRDILRNAEAEFDDILRETALLKTGPGSGCGRDAEVGAGQAGAGDDGDNGSSRAELLDAIGRAEEEKGMLREQLAQRRSEAAALEGELQTLAEELRKTKENIMRIVPRASMRSQAQKEAQW
eukprot:SM000289S10412  [mRNA]  locus=s289:122537:124845:- [translate_table: standard]